MDAAAIGNIVCIKNLRKTFNRFVAVVKSVLILILHLLKEKQGSSRALRQNKKAIHIIRGLWYKSTNSCEWHRSREANPTCQGQFKVLSENTTDEYSIRNVRWRNRDFWLLVTPHKRGEYIPLSDKSSLYLILCREKLKIFVIPQKLNKKFETLRWVLQNGSQAYGYRRLRFLVLPQKIQAQVVVLVCALVQPKEREKWVHQEDAQHDLLAFTSRKDCVGFCRGYN